MSLKNGIVTLGLIFSNIRLMTLTNYTIELVAPYSSIVFYKSLSGVKNTIKSLLLR
jgi:hypothetical protein